MNIPRCHNLGISAYIDAGKTTTTERILQLTGQMKRSGEKTDWKSPENCTSQPTVGQRMTAELIAKILP